MKTMNSMVEELLKLVDGLKAKHGTRRRENLRKTIESLFEEKRVSDQYCDATGSFLEVVISVLTPLSPDNHRISLLVMRAETLKRDLEEIRAKRKFTKHRT